MARVELPVVVKDSTTGAAISGAAIAISQRSTGAPVAWFTTETGGSSSVSAVITDSTGKGNAWVARGAYNLTVTGTGLATTTLPWDALPAADGGLEDLWLPSNSLPDAKVATGVDAAKITEGLLSPSRIGAASIATANLADAAVAQAQMASGSGIRLIHAQTLPAYDIAWNTGSPLGTFTLMASTPVVHNNRKGYIIAAHVAKVINLPDMYLFTFYKNGDLYSGGGPGSPAVGEAGIRWVFANLGVLSGTVNWSYTIRITTRTDPPVPPTSGRVVGKGSGLLMVVEVDY